MKPSPDPGTGLALKLVLQELREYHSMAESLTKYQMKTSDSSLACDTAEVLTIGPYARHIMPVGTSSGTYFYRAFIVPVSQCQSPVARRSKDWGVALEVSSK